MQIVVNSVMVVDASKLKIEEYLAQTDKDVDKIFAEVKRIVGAVKNKQLKALVDEFLADSS